MGIHRLLVACNFMEKKCWVEVGNDTSSVGYRERRLSPYSGLALGWCEVCPVRRTHDLVPYVRFRTYLWLKKGLVMYRERLVIPLRLKRQILKKVYDGHCGERRCMKRARMSIHTIRQDMKRAVEECPSCVESRIQRNEPLIGTPLPERPGGTVAMDYFQS